MKTVTATLTVKVTYQMCLDDTEEEVKETLHNAAYFLADEGMLSDGLNAEVKVWESKVDISDE